MLWLHYEDLHEDLPAAVRLIAEFLGIGADDAGTCCRVPHVFRTRVPSREPEKEGGMVLPSRCHAMGRGPHDPHETRAVSATLLCACAELQALAVKQGSIDFMRQFPDKYDEHM